MRTIAYILIVFSLLLLGAHFFRAGFMPAVVALAGLVILLAIRRPWAARCVQAGLAFGVVEWLRTLVVLVIERMHSGAPYQRMLVILSAVTLITVFAALLFQTRSLGGIYGLRSATDPDPAGSKSGTARVPTPHQRSRSPK